MGHTVTVLGASGYSGGELLRLLAAHPVFEVIAASGDRSAGRPVAEVHPHLAAFGSVLTDLGEAAGAGAEIVFSCLPSGGLGGLEIDASLVVDLSDDHRADEGWVYGLPEFNRSALPAARIANPGCYPTAVLLALVPFLRAGAIQEPIVVDALSGVSGAGRRAEDRLLFANLDGDVGAYGSTSHRHVPEMERYLAAFGDGPVTVSFTPHLVPLARGLLATARARIVGDLDDDAALQILTEAYENEPFITVTRSWPSVKAVAGSNSAQVSARVDRRAGWLICSAAIDNLGKGAAGQALQNANLCLGLDETSGLARVGVWP